MRNATRGCFSLISRYSLRAVIFSVVAVILLPTSYAGAIVTDNVATSETSPLEASGDWDIDWNYVYRYSGCSSVAVNPYWLLTAKHVPNVGNGNPLTIEGTTYTQFKRVDHATADLALVRLDDSLPGYYEPYQNSVDNMDAIMIGYGLKGTVYTDSTYSGTTGTQGTKRWGTNQIVSGTGSELMYMLFNLETDKAYNNRTTHTTDYEAGVADKDSGGGTFVKDPTDGTWKLAGINTGVYPAPSGSQGSYSASGGVRVQNYIPWIEDVLSNPDYFYYPSILGDANLDGVVDSTDYTIWANNYTGVEGTGGTWTMGDFNFDGAMDSVDYTIWANHYDAVSSGSPMNPAPEPATVSLLGLGALALLRRRNR